LHEGDGLAIGDRYATPVALADDIEHWLADEPVSAWREPWRVRARRWLSRHRTLVTTSAAVVLVTTVSLAVASVLLAAANERERAAHAEAAHNYDIARRAVDGYVAAVNKDELLHAPAWSRCGEPAGGRQQVLRAIRARERPKAGVKAGLGGRCIIWRRSPATSATSKMPSSCTSAPRTCWRRWPPPSRPIRGADRLARCWHHLGRLYRLTYRLDKSEAAYTEALSIWKKLAQESPPGLYRAELARASSGSATCTR